MNTHSPNPPYVDFVGPSNITSNARIMLSLILIGAACVFADLLVGTRSIDVGTDTYVYAEFFRTLHGGSPETRFEPGFLLVTRVLSVIGFSVEAYQMVLFGILLATAIVAVRHYFDYLGARHGLMTLLTASLMFLLFSPMFVNASINAVRQGLAALLVFTALLAFQQRQWRTFFIYGVLATSFHYSSLMYLVFAPLLLNLKLLRVIAVVAFLAYVAGLTMIVVRTASPFIYNTVMDYSLSSKYRSGVRIDFAVFSIFWYALPFIMAPMVRKPIRSRINDSTAVYLVMLLPFFAVGWGNFSNRYLLPAYLAISLMVAAIFCFNRLSILRNPILLRAGLIFSCAAFYYYVTHQVVV
ncbi:EpsG family protein [Dyella flava]|uniref:EpsG family protein n=1 Tax=Dyella flava TaxID=1920170 RepID=A0ABS2K304_9GAMM|nr:EpsG family protein [Dyella flava]MBM7125050.1 EpsG family protein [Dyella flava]GLQ51922.1 hypothetical protein GCM10010872_33710 [Dyella flava]